MNQEGEKMTPDFMGTILAAIDTLRSDLTQRLDDMVTRREHEAEIRRLDGEVAHLCDALGQVRDSIRATLEERRSERKWMIGTVIAAVSVAIAAVSVIISALN